MRIRVCLALATINNKKQQKDKEQDGKNDLKKVGLTDINRLQLTLTDMNRKYRT